MKSSIFFLASFLAAGASFGATCYTKSVGIPFQTTHWDRGTAAQAVASECRSHIRTINSECDANVYCDGGNSGSSVVCSTQSQGIPFELVGFDQMSVQQSIISQCHAHPRTINAECDRNLLCRGGNFPPPPPPPPPCKPGINCPGDNPPPPPPPMISCSVYSQSSEQTVFVLSGPFANRQVSFGTDYGGRNFRANVVNCNGMEGSITGIETTPGFPGTSYVTVTSSKPGMSISGCRIDASANWRTTSYHCN